MQHFSSLKKTQVIELPLRILESFQRLQKVAFHLPLCARAVQDIRVGYPVEVLRVTDQNLSHIRTAAENSRENVQCLWRFRQVSEQSRSVQSCPRQPFKVI